MVKKILASLLILITLTNSLQAQQLLRERVYKINSSRKSINSSELTRQGNIIYAGPSSTGNGWNTIFTLVQPNTDTLWTRNGPLLKNGDLTIKEVPGGGFAFLGTVQQTGTTGNQIDALLQRMDINGFSKWWKVYDYTVNDKIDLALVAPDSGYFLAGMGGVNGNLSRFFLSRTDSLGNVKWQKDYTWSGNDYVMDMKYNRHGEIIMAGTTTSLVTPFPMILKLQVVNQNGDTIRSRRLAIRSQTREQRMIFTYNSLTPLSDGGYLLTANIDTAINASSSAWMGMVVKTNANLQPVWHYIKRTTPVKQHIFTKAKELVDGSVVVLAFESIPYTNKFYLYRFGPTGTLLNTYTFTSAIAAEIRGITLDALPDTSFMIGGEATVTPFPNYTNGFYVAKVKIAGLPQVLSLKPEMPEKASKATLGQAYPNPAAAEATIPYVLPKGCKAATLTINEIVTGRQVKSYTLKPDEVKLQVDLHHFSNGIYTYTLVIDGNPVATRKLAVTR